MDDLDSERGVGPISGLLSDRPPFGPIQRLDGDQLREEQNRTLGTRRRLPSIGAKVLFITMDLAYGTPRTLERFAYSNLWLGCRTRRGRTLGTSRSRILLGSHDSLGGCSIRCV